MQSKSIHCLSGITLILGIMFITACTKKDNTNPPGGGGGDSTKPNIETGAPETYTKKVLVEEFTGTWCGWCPRMPVLLEKLHQKYPNLIVSAFHGIDTFDIGKEVRSVIEDKLGVQGYPTSKLERVTDLDWYDNNNNISFGQADSLVNTYMKKAAVLGLGINSTISGNILNITVKVGMGQALNIAKAKVMVYVVEDGLTGPRQTNYYSDDQVKNDYKNDPDLGALTLLPHYITGYTYNHVVRKVLTDAKGDEIPAAYKIKGAVFSKDYSIDISKYKAANCHLIALVYGQDDEGKLVDTFNTQVVVAGQSQKFD
ncbi:thioredoxin [Chitinophaga niastensis]|uniref:Thioredoxin n=1 Tax=Chitinophaga niastensis TaxID=536980 RepID=A0A2P8HA02_CHINA|nr:Omp28-related outer membrane protein [Chitinophaga niastensis]PSL43057.1 thioredoxin [Chitinophaga niastensis]